MSSTTKVVLAILVLALVGGGIYYKMGMEKDSVENKEDATGSVSPAPVSGSAGDLDAALDISAEIESSADEEADVDLLQADSEVMSSLGASYETTDLE